MKDDDINTFIQALKDFMFYSQEQIYLMEEKLSYADEAKLAIEKEIEKKAAELEVTVDYYIQEFM